MLVFIYSAERRSYTPNKHSILICFYFPLRVKQIQGTNVQIYISMVEICITASSQVLGL